MIIGEDTGISIGLAVIFFGAVGGLYIRFQYLIARLKDELAAYKVEVAEKYASRETIDQMENRLIDAINRLGDRLDRKLDRERVS